MSAQYKASNEVPSDVLCARLKELSKIIPEGREAMRDEFTMRIPAEVDRDADIVIAEAATRILQLESQLRAAETTTTAMGLAYSEIKQENERLREVLEEFIAADQKAVSDLREMSPDYKPPQSLVDLHKRAAEALANHFGDANKMVSDGKEGA